MTQGERWLRDGSVLLGRIPSTVQVERLDASVERLIASLDELIKALQGPPSDTKRDALRPEDRGRGESNDDTNRASSPKSPTKLHPRPSTSTSAKPGGPYS